MNETWREEWRELRERQRRLEARLARCEEESETLRELLAALEAKKPAEETTSAVLQESASPEKAEGEQKKPAPPITPPPLPAPESPVAAREPEESAPVAHELPEEAWEMRFGRVWLVRIGIFLLLTGLVFLSTYAYQNWLFATGPGVKVAFFLVLSLLLSLAGQFLEKRRAEMRHYGRVLVAGGLAAAYYTLYAAHFVPSLQVIDSVVLAALLLTFWAGLMILVAAWKESELMAFFALGLAYFAMALNPAGALVLWSLFLLSAAGIFLLLRFRWRSLGLGVLLAAYGAQAWWWWSGQVTVDPGTRLSFITLLWVLFFLAALLPGGKTFTRDERRVFVALNNSLAWLLLAFDWPQVAWRAEFGEITLTAGVLSGILTALTFWKRADADDLRGLFAFQSIVWLSLAMMALATGEVRFLVLALEASVLWSVGRKLAKPWLQVISGVAILFAYAFATPALRGEGATWGAYFCLSLLSGVYGVLLRRDGRGEALLVAIATWLVWLLGVCQDWSSPVVYGATWLVAGALAAGAFWTRGREWLADLIGVGQVVAALSFVLFVIEIPDPGTGWQVVSFGFVALFWWLSPQLWERLLGAKNGESVMVLAEWLFAFLSLVLGLAALLRSSELALVLTLGPVAVLAFSGLGEVTGRRSAAVMGLAFYPLVALALLGGVLVGEETSAGWLTLALGFGHFFLVDRWWRVLPVRVMRPLLGAVCGGLVVMKFALEPSLALLIWPLTGCFFVGWSWWRREAALLLAGGLWLLLISATMALLMSHLEGFQRYSTLLLVLLAHGFLCLKWRDDTGGQRAARFWLFAVGWGSVLVAVSTDVLDAFHGNGLVVAWGALALVFFAVGLALRSRPYRLGALGLIGLSVGHVMLVDVMKLGSLGRILSFLSLGVVLLALGYVYNRYHEAIRKIL
ncbi:MAG: DUF2339 domain-containing protein [Verrucomicrobiales bacterium]